MSNIVTDKFCNKCKKRRPATSFCKDKAKQDGLTVYCKDCRNKEGRERRVNNPNKDREYKRKWRANNLEKARASSRDWNSRNIERHKVNSQKWKLLNKEKALEQKRKWQKANPEKVTEYSHTRRANKNKNGGKITAKEWRDLKEKYNNKCLCCGRSDVALTLDHVIPLSINGSNTIENAQPLCGVCNSRKGTKHIDYRQT